jgi:hypothetical protein
MMAYVAAIVGSDGLRHMNDAIRQVRQTGDTIRFCAVASTSPT